MAEKNLGRKDQLAMDRGKKLGNSPIRPETAWDEIALNQSSFEAVVFSPPRRLGAILKRVLVSEIAIIVDGGRRRRRSGSVSLRKPYAKREAFPPLPMPGLAIRMLGIWRWRPWSNALGRHRILWRVSPTMASPIIRLVSSLINL